MLEFLESLRHQRRCRSVGFGVHSGIAAWASARDEFDSIGVGDILHN